MSINKALIVSRLAHQGQQYGDGRPYFEAHISEVVKRVDLALNAAPEINASHALQVAYLHDVLEDTPVTAEELSMLGFAPEVIKAVEALTRPKGATYMDYVRSMVGHPLAKLVKIADLKTNLSHCEPWDSRVDRYTKAIAILEAKQ